MISHLGRYEIIEEVGQGAMGVVYKAKDPLIDRWVAIKAINLKNLAKDERAVYEARFYQEAKAAGRLNHPNILTIYDLGETGDIAYIAMELLEGRELQNILADNKRLPIDDVLDISIQVATGLEFAHQHGIVHRDIKPSNIMVLKDNHIKIADFGIARMEASLFCTHSDKVLGSPLFMSPEQVLSQEVDARSDIFSLGIVLYRMLTGQLPFFGENANTVMYQIVNQEPKKPSLMNPDVSATLDAIVLKCLAKKAEERYQHAGEVANDLLSCHTILPHAQVGKNRKRRYFGIDALMHAPRLNKWAIIGGFLLIGVFFISFFEIIENFVLGK